jgi:hypothetical protein
VLDVVVEREQVDLAGFDPALDLVDGVQIEGLLPEVQARVAGELALQRVQRAEEGERRVATPQARLPRAGERVEGRGDAVRDELAVGVAKRDAWIEADPRARHELPFEGIAVQIDEARQDQEAIRAQRDGVAHRLAEALDSLGPGDEIGQLDRAVGQQHAAA